MRRAFTMLMILACLSVLLIAPAHAGRHGWSIQPGADPPPSTSIGLRSVACLGRTWCIAVGASYDTAPHVLAEVWEGGAWRIVPSDDPPDAFYTPGMYSVSCATRGMCVTVGAVGHVDGSFSPVLESWDGSTWSMVSMPIPPGASDVFLRGVSCPAPTACIAVGHFTLGSSNIPLIERWDGSAWSLEIGSPYGATFDGVTCLDLADCTVVGSILDGNVVVPLAEHWDGTSWTVDPVPPPDDGFASGLTAVDCPRTDACVAVGSSLEISGSEMMLAEAWDGSVWSEITPPLPPHASSARLWGISCPAKSTCFAVGGDSRLYGPIVERWIRGGWTAQAVPKPPHAVVGSVLGVSCAEPRTCTAVGTYAPRSSPDLALIVHHAR